MAFTSQPQFPVSHASRLSGMYAPPLSTATFAATASLFASSSVQPRHRGHSQARHHSVRVVYPEHYHQVYHLPLGIEEQPF